MACSADFCLIGLFRASQSKQAFDTTSDLKAFSSGLRAFTLLITTTLLPFLSDFFSSFPTTDDWLLFSSFSFSFRAYLQRLLWMDPPTTFLVSFFLRKNVLFWPLGILTCLLPPSTRVAASLLPLHPLLLLLLCLHLILCYFRLTGSQLHLLLLS